MRRARLVDRHGYHQPRTVVTSAGAVEVKAPRVNDKRTDPETGERQRFSSAILPAWARRSPRLRRPRPLGRGLCLPVGRRDSPENTVGAGEGAGGDHRVRRAYGAEFPKAVAKIVDDADVLLEFYHYPAEHWIHLRTTNHRIYFRDSTFEEQGHQGAGLAGGRARGRPGSRAAGLAMAFKLIEAAEARWRAVNAPHLVALVRAGAVFEKGKLIERQVDSSTTKGAA
jgi:hypothetical protein